MMTVVRAREREGAREKKNGEKMRATERKTRRVSWLSLCSPPRPNNTPMRTLAPSRGLAARAPATGGHPPRRPVRVAAVQPRQRDGASWKGGSENWVRLAETKKMRLTPIARPSPPPPTPTAAALLAATTLTTAPAAQAEDGVDVAVDGVIEVVKVREKEKKKGGGSARAASHAPAPLNPHPRPHPHSPSRPPARAPRPPSARSPPPRAPCTTFTTASPPSPRTWAPPSARP